LTRLGCSSGRMKYANVSGMPGRDGHIISNLN